MISKVSLLVMAPHVRLTAVGDTTRCEGSGLAPAAVRGGVTFEGRCPTCGKSRDVAWLDVK